MCVESLDESMTMVAVSLSVSDKFFQRLVRVLSIERDGWLLRVLERGVRSSVSEVSS